MELFIESNSINGLILTLQGPYNFSECKATGHKILTKAEIKIPEKSFSSICSYIKKIYIKNYEEETGFSFDYDEPENISALYKTLEELSYVICLEDGVEFVYFFQITDNKAIIQKGPRKFNSKNPLKGVSLIETTDLFELVDINKFFEIIMTEATPIKKFLNLYATRQLEEILEYPELFSSDSF